MRPGQTNKNQIEANYEVQSPINLMLNDAFEIKKSINKEQEKDSSQLMLTCQTHDTYHEMKIIS
jgi:hypothetical protein